MEVVGLAGEMQKYTVEVVAVAAVGVRVRRRIVFGVVLEGAVP